VAEDPASQRAAIKGRPICRTQFRKFCGGGGSGGKKGKKKDYGAGKATKRKFNDIGLMTLPDKNKNKSGAVSFMDEQKDLGQGLNPNGSRGAG